MKIRKFLRFLNRRIHEDSKSGPSIFIDESGQVESNVPLNTSEKSILENLLSFRSLRVSEVMIPRTDLVGIESSASFEHIKQSFIEHGYTRMPVYRENMDDIIGFLHIKDFIHYMDGTKTFKIHDVMRKVIYSLRSTKCIDLLSYIKSGTTHIAIVLDEYGGTEGMVVLESLVEKIVGDIKDEHDKAPGFFICPLNDNCYKIDARASIQDVEETLKVSLSQEDGEYETFGGFILSYLDRVPIKGEKVLHPMGFEIEILDAELRRIKSTKVQVLQDRSQKVTIP